MTLKCIIIDDEPLAIKLLESYVSRVPFLELINTYLDPIQALNNISPDIELIFMDIEMPGLNGIELSKLISSKTKIIFTTAYKQYAFDSYEVQAIDYLLKPISYSAFVKATTRAKEYFEQINKPQQEEITTSKNDNFIFVKSEFKLIRVDLDNILYICALKDYVRIFLSNATRPITALTTMKAIAEKLPQDRFCRVHRSYIIALDKIEHIERNRIKIGKEIIPVAEAKVDDLIELINI